MSKVVCYYCGNEVVDDSCLCFNRQLARIFKAKGKLLNENPIDGKRRE